MIEHFGASGREELTVMVEVPELAAHGAAVKEDLERRLKGGGRPAHDRLAGRRARAGSAYRAVWAAAGNEDTKFKCEDGSRVASLTT